MGGHKQYQSGGGFDQYLYHQVGEIISANGISAKVVEKVDKSDPAQGLPLYSNTAELYLGKGRKSGEIVQLRLYKGRKAFMDIDWSHPHGNIPSGTVHVHFYEIDNTGKPRKNTAKYRRLNNAEIRKYGALIKKVAPNAKLR